MNVIGQIVAGFASLVTILLAYTIFSPIINGILSGLVRSAISDSGGTALSLNASAFELTVNILIMGWNVFAFFVCFAIFVRIFLALGFLQEETNAGGY